MRFYVRRILAYSTVAMYLFLAGTENAIILPTAWQYLNYIGITDEFLLGATLSVFSISATISGLLGGRIADSYPNHTKPIVITCVAGMIIGNIQYFLGGSIINIIMGRVICGMGSGAGAALLAEVCRTTSTKERTAILSICNGLRQVGLLIGPGFQIILEYFDCTLFDGALVIRPFNAPGLFMAFLWVVFLLFACIFYRSIFIEYTYEMLRREQRAGDELLGRSLVLSWQSYGSASSGQSSKESVEQDEGIDFETGLFHSGSEIDPEIERSIVESAPPVPLADTDTQTWFYLTNVGYTENKPDEPITWRTYLDEFLHDDTVSLFALTIVLFFGQVSVETVIPPLMSQFFGYTSFETSLFYMVGGIISIVIYCAVALTTKWTSDVYLLTLGWILQILGFVWFLIWLPSLGPGEPEKMPAFAIGVLLLYLGFPVACVGATALITKCVSAQVQGMGQGLRRLGSFVGLTLGPLWGGATVHNSQLQMGVPLALLIIMAVLFGFSFAKIRGAERAALSSRK